MTTLPGEVKNAVAKALRESRWLVPAPAVELILTAALPFLSVQGAVKKLEWGNARITEDGRETEDAESPVGRYIATDTGWFLLGRTGYEVERGLYQAKAAAQADYEARILSALEPSAARKLALEELRNLLERLSKAGTNAFNAMSHYAENNAATNAAMNDLSDALDAAIRALSSPDHADAPHERAWYFNAGDYVPAWLEKIEKGNCTLTFGVDVVVTSKDGGYEVRPQGIADNAGPILHVVSHGNVTPEIKGGGNGVAIIGYNRPYDETAEGKIERLKRLLEMALPYVECYDTREHNAEQDAVLTEIDKALSVLTEGDHIDDAGKVEGDGWMPIESAPKDGRFVDLWHVSQGRVPDCRWFTNNQKFTGWHAQQGGRAYNMGGDKMFTHWRHLPSAPSEGAE